MKCPPVFQPWTRQPSPTRPADSTIKGIEQRSGRTAAALYAGLFSRVHSNRIKQTGSTKREHEKAFVLLPSFSTVQPSRLVRLLARGEPLSIRQYRYKRRDGRQKTGARGKHVSPKSIF
jgi:hypothetical protein